MNIFRNFLKIKDFFTLYEKHRVPQISESRIKMNQQPAIPNSTASSPLSFSPTVSSSTDNSARLETPAASPQQPAQNGPAIRPRCAHLFQSGRRCRRQLFETNSRFCPRHAKLPENLQPDDLTAELTNNPQDLDTFDGLHSFLEALVILLSQNRISTRRAAVLGYLTSQLIRTLSAAHKEEDQTPLQLILDAPRPIRD
jgi:hypothetical protein